MKRLAEAIGYIDKYMDDSYEMKSVDFEKVGRMIFHRDFPFDEFDAKELAMGIKVEMEHLPKDGDPALKRMIARQIAGIHLLELKDYYTRLKNMESGK